MQVLAMAIEIIVVGVFAGIALGLRYKVLILVPAVACAMAIAVVMGIVRADHFWSIALAMVALAGAIQFGYLVGIFMRAAIGSICARHVGSRIIPNK
jgi:hypothetical protein